MPSYLITGASRGIGLAFLENLSSTPGNTVIGLVRNVADTEVKIAEWKRTNIHLIQGDLTNYESLKSAVDATSKITGGSLDYLIANAGLVPGISAREPFSVLGQDPDQLQTQLVELFQINVVGNIHLFNLFLPLILKSDIKKVITISSGMADIELARTYSIYENALYSISKAAVNMAMAKFSAEYAKEGVLFLSVCPGMVDTGHNSGATEKQGKKFMALSEKFMQYQPDFKGPITPEESVKDVLNVIEKASVANGDGGAYYSHLGKGEKWL
ncbi:NAD(P)-binding protein [Clathrospora elynae]|uniref:NAD(P)-binding protein n=1 Tax=Clathrospora elynae TaxID=706981 RepID=A0A6A5TFW7_9PLEO|nr:NAD(P)-binding protein [Clathrospora elynae]